MHIWRILLVWLIIAIVIIVGLLASGMVKVDIEVTNDPDDDEAGKHRDE